jgi:branched-chain amino acid transport system substrate-binding protein
MIRHKRVTRVAAALAVLGLVVAACGDDDQGVSPTTTSAPTTTSPSGGGGDSPTTTAEPVDEGCDESKPFEVGGLFSLSGPAGDIGALAKEGVEMVEADINAAGGVLGRCLKVLLRDDESDPTKGSLKARELVDQEEVEFLVGPFLSSICAATLEVTAPVNLLQMAACVLPDAGDATKYPYVFRTEVVATLQGVTFVDYVSKNGWTKIGALAVNNALGTSSLDAVKANLAAGQSVVAEEFHESGVVDLTAQMRKLQQAGAEVVLMLNTAAPDQIASVNARNGLNWDVPMLGFSSLGNAATRDALGAANMVNVYGGQAYRLLNRAPGSDVPVGDAAKAFIERYRQHRGESVLTVNIQQAAGIYDSFKLFVDAINSVGSTDPDAVKAYLESKVHEGIKATYEYNSDRHDGVGLDDLVFVEGSSLEDGILTLAPNQ